MNPLQKRDRVIRLAFSTIFLFFTVALSYIQIGRHAYFSQQQKDQATSLVTTPALRAGIYDRNGSILAVSQPTMKATADNFQISDPHTEAIQLHGFLHMPTSKIYRMIARRGPGSGDVTLKSDMTLADGHALASLNLPGIIVSSNYSRIYPNGQIAKSLLGGMNNAGGSAGIEYMYNSMMAGQAGEVMATTVHQSSHVLPAGTSHVIRRAVPGQGLELTIDSSLQYVTEHALAVELHQSGAIQGTAIVMDVKTGQLLAVSSLVNTEVDPGVLGPIPSWGVDMGVKGVQQTINNGAFSQAYEPGSVFKLVAFSAALNDQLVTPNTTFRVPNGVHVGGRYFHDAENHRTLTMTSTDILAQSSNIGTYLVAKQVGSQGLLAQVQRLGFGQTTDINFPGETAGLLKDASTWRDSDIVALPIGQVDAVPPIQVLDAYNTIANHGVFIQPKLVLAYVRPDGSVVPTPKSATRPALTPYVAATLNSMLQKVVLAGTGTNAIIPGYAVAGKTGTATIPRPGHASLLIGSYNASFVGYAPANNPIFSMIVVIQKPRTSIFGGMVAAPVFQQVMSYALHHWGIPSTGTFVKPLKGVASVASDVT